MSHVTPFPPQVTTELQSTLGAERGGLFFKAVDSVGIALNEALTSINKNPGLHVTIDQGAAPRSAAASNDQQFASRVHHEDKRGR